MFLEIAEKSGYYFKKHWFALILAPVVFALVVALLSLFYDETQLLVELLIVFSGWCIAALAIAGLYSGKLWYKTKPKEGSFLAAFPELIVASKIRATLYICFWLAFAVYLPINIWLVKG